MGGVSECIYIRILTYNQDTLNVWCLHDIDPFSSLRKLQISANGITGSASRLAKQGTQLPITDIDHMRFVLFSSRNGYNHYVSVIIRQI